MTVRQELWLVGADDFATETQACNGWTFFALPEGRASEFESEGREILSKYKGIVKLFHGKKYHDHEHDAYSEFLNLIRKALEAGACACNSLVDQQMASQLEGFAKRLIGNSISGGAPQAKDKADAAAAYGPVLFNALRCMAPLGAHRMIRLQIDDDGSWPALVGSKIIELSFTSSHQLLLAKAANAYRECTFPEAPSIADYAVETMRDNRSMLIQAADVLGNFSMAHVFVTLGHKSKKRTSKAALLGEVFGDTMASFDFSSHIDLRDNDFTLRAGGSLTLQIRLRPHHQGS